MFPSLSTSAAVAASPSNVTIPSAALSTVTASFNSTLPFKSTSPNVTACGVGSGVGSGSAILTAFAKSNASHASGE